jgi:hypothetical protein
MLAVTKKLREEQKNSENTSRYPWSGRARNALYLSEH